MNRLTCLTCVALVSTAACGSSSNSKGGDAGAVTSSTGGVTAGTGGVTTSTGGVTTGTGATTTGTGATTGGTTGGIVTGAKAGSGFEVGDDGWTIAGDAQTSSVKPDYNGMGGNPDGLISAKDDVTGGVWYFVAPAKYHGVASNVFGQALGFDLKTDTINSPFPAYDVMISGGGLTIATTAPDDPLPVNSWKSYNVLLGQGAGWHVVTNDAIATDADLTTFPAATDADIQAVLADVTLLKIRGEYNSGPDTGYLDNVRFGTVNNAPGTTGDGGATSTTSGVTTSGSTTSGATATGSSTSGATTTGASSTGARATTGSATSTTGTTGSTSSTTGSTTGTEQPWTSVIGTSCAGGTECSAIPTGYCAAAGLCVRMCAAHPDCGCAAGSTNADIAAGRCSAACIDIAAPDAGAPAPYCFRVCVDPIDCDVGTTCTPLSTFSVCAPN